MVTGPHTDDPTLAVVIERLDNLRNEVAAMRGEMQQQAAGYVSRAEFEAWRTGMDRDVVDLKSKRAPWWSVAAIIVAIVVAAATIIPALTP